MSQKRLAKRIADIFGLEWEKARAWILLVVACHDLGKACPFEDIRCQWLKSVWGTLRTAWEQHRVSVSMGDAWAIRALVKAEVPVVRLKDLNEEILKLEPQKEDA